MFHGASVLSRSGRLQRRTQIHHLEMKEAPRWSRTRQGEKRRRRRPQRGAGGAAPVGGTACPPVSKNVGGRSGRGNGARQANPSGDGGRRPRQDHPSPSAGGRRPRLPCQPPIAKYEQLCYGSPMKSDTGPLLFLGALPAYMSTALTTEHPPMAGALREHPKGQDPPRKAGTGANAVVRHRLPGVIQLRNDS